MCVCVCQENLLRLVNIEYSVRGQRELLQPGRVRVQRHHCFSLPPVPWPFHNPHPLVFSCPDEKVVYFRAGLCEGGHPDECQQEEPTVTPPLSGKLAHRSALTFKSRRNPSDDSCWALLHLCVNRRVPASPSGPDRAIKSRVSWQDVSDCSLPAGSLLTQQGPTTAATCPHVCTCGPLLL